MLAETTFIGWRADEWEAIGTWMAAVVTGVGLWFAGRQVREASRAADEQARQAFAQTRPYIILEPSFDSVLALLKVRNVGQTPALDVDISLDSPVTSTSPFLVDWQSVGLFQNGTPFFGPGQEFTYILDSMPARLDSDLPMTITGTVEYGPPDLGGARHRERFVIDLGAYDATRLYRNYQAEIADHLREIAGKLQG